MPENVLKIPQSPSPVAGVGAGDISERELSRERHNMQTTPPTARVQPAHPKKQLFSVPVNKFTAKGCSPGPNLARIRSCLRQYTSHNCTPARPPRVRPKAVSMEDLTPTKRLRIERKNRVLSVVSSPGPGSAARAEAGARVARFVLLCAWRRRREDVRCLRKTLECQVSCSERLRMQVSALKSLLDSDNCKLRLAMRELERLKQLLRDKDLEKAVLEKEKMALERDVCAAEDQASEMSIGWRNCRNELEGARSAAALAQRALAHERAAAADARAQRDRAFHTLSGAEAEVSQQRAELQAARARADELGRALLDRQRLLDRAHDQLAAEKKVRWACEQQCAALGARAAAGGAEAAGLRAAAGLLRAELARRDQLLRDARAQLDWWPAPLTKMMGAARAFLRRPLSLPEACVWALLPARHGC